MSVLFSFFEVEVGIGQRCCRLSLIVAVNVLDRGAENRLPTGREPVDPQRHSGS